VSAVTRDDVLAAYEILLERAPESEDVVAAFLAMPSAAAVFRAIAGSPEARMKRVQTPLRWYNASFDPIETIIAHENPDRRPVEGHLVNWLGVAIDTRFVPVKDAPSGVEGPPIPANWHSDVAEFGAALRAVDLATDRFTMVELGCGWGCWMNITGVAAKRRGLAVTLIGVEGDETHLGFARETLTTNGFRPDEFTLHRGIAAQKQGRALFPKQREEGGHWGLQPIFDATPEERARAVATARFDDLPMLSLDGLIGDRTTIDLIHMDIQGGEADFVRDCIEVLTARVKYLVIGTHSREIEGRLFETLLAAGWELEIERPLIFEIENGRPVMRVDGVQGWRNPKSN
jgi:hypothetical protein